MRLLDDLMEIGFTEYEAKVYLALLREHPATGYQLSKESGVPRSMVYETLKRLHSQGAALETVEGRSTLYRPVPPDRLLDRHEHDYRRRIAELHDGLTELYQEVPDERVWTLAGRPTVLSYAAQLLREAQRELFLVLADEDLSALQEEIAAACARGVAANTLLTGEGLLGEKRAAGEELPLEQCGHVAHHPPLETELQELADTLLVAVDDAIVLIASTNPGRETTATVTRSPHLVLIARQFVWMELFTQRVYERLGPDLLQRLDAQDRRIFESRTGREEE